MPVFVYQATDKSGKLIEGSMEAKDESAIINRLYSSQLRPVNISRDKGGKGLQANLFSFPVFGGVRVKDVLEFTQKLSTLLNAGLNLDRSLTILIDLNEKESMRKVAESVQKNVHGGSSFADAISKYPQVFSKLYASMIKAGEEGGVLEVILERIAEFMETTEKMKENVVSAMIYPAILTIAGGGAVALLMTFVVPKFASIFSDMGQAIPAPTLLLLNISAFLTTYWWSILIVGITVIILFRVYTSTKSGGFLLDQSLLKVPGLGTILRMIQVARFTKTLGTLINSGVPILKALMITNETLTNSAIASAMTTIPKQIKEGVGISTPLKECGVFPPLAVHMIQVGEETGKLDEMLLKVANVYEGEIEKAVKRFIVLFEPLMILSMGIIVGFIVVCILLAIISMNDLPI